MSSIRIISTPPGQAPEWVRKEWMGIKIPLPGQVSGGIEMGVLGGEARNTGGYQVNTVDAIEVLRKKSPKAAKWWDENGLVAFAPSLVFSKDVCELVS